MRLSLITLLLLAGTAFAQPDRYELGRRAHAFEAAWDEKIDDAAAKKRAAVHVKEAVDRYLSLDFSGAAKEVDAARHALESAEPAPPAVRWADALQVLPASRAVDAATAELSVSIKRFYKPDGAPAPTAPVVRLRLGTGKPVEASLDSLPTTVKVPVKDVPGSPSADFKLTAEILADGKVLATRVVTVSRIERFDERLTAVKKAFAPVPNPPTTIEQATFGLLVKTLGDLAKKGSPETDYPSARLMAGAERLATVTEPYYIAKRGGEFWLSVPTGKTSTIIRIRIPQKLDERKDPVPVLVALHGLGGSENVYFDGYGNGVIPRMASDRGWIVLGPRVEGPLGAGPAPPVGAILDELAKRYPIDAKKVFLVGHSLGAAHAIQLAQKDPGRYAAIAVLGGGGKVTKPEALKSLPIFVGVGKLDFTLASAESLHKALEAAACPVTLKEYDDVDHLLVVRESAADVFKFFESAKGK